MAQHRQSGYDIRFGGNSRSHHDDYVNSNGNTTDLYHNHIAIGIRSGGGVGGTTHHKQSRGRRFGGHKGGKKFSIGTFVVVLCLILAVTAIAYIYVSGDKGNACELKFLNSTSQLVEPLESRKFARFNLQYTSMEEKLEGVESWEPRFAGHQSLREREESFTARDQQINCGFVKGPRGYPNTGFDLADNDAKFISKCHIAVVSCIFGSSDNLRSPTSKAVTRLSRKNVCFVMFMDEITLQTLTADGQIPDRMGFIGLWKIVIVKSLLTMICEE